MNTLLYSVGLSVYYGLVRIASLFNKRAKALIDGRKLDSVQNPKVDQSLPNMWIHCASHGEYETAKPLIKRYQSTHQIHLTFYSPSGYQVAINEQEFWRSIRYLPFDGHRQMTKLVEEINPNVVIFIQYEYWYYLLQTLVDKNVPYIYYGVKLSSNHILSKRYMKFLKDKVNQSRLILVRDDDSLKLSKKLFNTSVYNVGDVRWLQAKANIQTNPFDLDHLETHTIVLGSVWKEDLSLWLPIIHQRLDLNFVIAPHNISPQNIQAIQNSIGTDHQLYSQKKNNLTTQTQSRIIIVDTIGDLKYLYKGATIVYIGGGLGDGLHNCIEAAVYAVPVIVSGDLDNNPEVKKLIDNGYSTRINSSEEITETISKYMTNAQLESYESYIAAEIAQCQKALSLLDSEIYV